MKRRKLPLRRRRKNFTKPVRVSYAVLDVLEGKRKGLRSYDAVLRRTYGLPDWRGRPQPLIEGCLEVTTGRFFPKTESWEQAEMDANEVAIIEAVKAKTKKVNKPIRLREIA